jgi:hypothetical protein
MIKMLTVIVVILLGWLILITYVPEHQLQVGFEKIWHAVQTASIVSISLVVLTVFGALCWLAWVGYSHGIIWRSEARIRRAQADGEELHANLIITTVAPGSQVYASETGRLNLTHKPLYLAAGNVNGKAIEYTPEESRRWAFLTSLKTFPESRM